MSQPVDNPMHGVLVVDKPSGMTSAAVVARAKRMLGAKKVGHTGTLDPMATGVLPLCLGEATKLAGYLLADDKAYQGELELGVETDTLDAEGEVTARAPGLAAAITAAQLERAMREFLGAGAQIPPMYSAIKQGGRRLHELARAGHEVERAPRPIVIHAFELIGFSSPRARFRVECSKGTYVRVLVADIGHALGCGAHLTALRRTRSGSFDIAQAVKLDDLATAELVPPPEALAHLPAAVVPEALIRPIRDGKPITWDALDAGPHPAGLCRLLLPSGHLLALITVSGGRIRYTRVFTYGLT